jgi:hypothetical protein
MLLPAEQQLSTGFYVDYRAPAARSLLVKETVFIESRGDYPIGTERLRNDYGTATEGLPFYFFVSLRILNITSQTYIRTTSIPNVHDRY